MTFPLSSYCGPGSIAQFGLVDKSIELPFYFQKTRKLSPTFAKFEETRPGGD